MLRVANANLINAAANDDQTRDHLAETENVVDAHVQFDAAQIDVRNDA